jgi:Flp pilus assembly protein TadD/mono/diheme cytochrome c family protein
MITRLRALLFASAVASGVSGLDLFVTGIAGLLYVAVPVSGAAQRTAEPAVTWSQQIAPLLYNNCTTCHRPGGAGPFSLLTYQDARRWGAQMKTVTSSRYMPPWLPEHGYGEFQDQRRLSDEQIAQIARWVQTGMPQGDLSAAPPVPQYRADWQYGTPDLILTVERPLLLPASGTDVFENFVLPYPLKQTHYIRAMEIRPVVPRIVHHANLLIDRTASFRHAHPEQWKGGIPGMELAVDTGNEFDPDSHFLFWKPDTPVLVEPKGMPWRLDPGNDLILNMHLKPSGKPEVASAQVGLYFTDQPPSAKPMLLQLEHDKALDIPAGTRDFVVEDSLRLPVDVEVLGIYPHAHYLGKRLEAWAILPDQQKQWLILIPSWDIDRQSVYRYRKPVFLPKGSVVHMHYIYDNSSSNPHNPHVPPVRVKAGNRSEDEMAHLWLQVLPVNTSKSEPDPRLLLEEAWMRNWLSKDPADIIPLYNLGSALAGEGRYQEAVAAFRRALALHPGDDRLLNQLGAVLENSGDWRQAQKIYREDITAHPDTCNARFDLGRLELKHEEARDAEQQFRTMLQQCPMDAAVHSGLGVALANEGQQEAARAEFRAALQVDSQDFTALYNLGVWALQANQTQQAVELLEAAAKQRPNDVDAQEELADAYASSGRLDEAVIQLRKAILVEPQDAALHTLLSQALAGTGQLEQAVAEEKAALHLRADDPDDWNNLGVLEARTHRFAEAREDFLHALRLSPNHAQARVNLDRLPPS